MSVPEQKQLVEQLAQSGRLAEARSLCTSLCNDAADDPDVWLMLGVINGELSDFPQAESCCRRALSLSPDNVLFNFNLAVTLIKQGKTTESTEILDKCLVLQPDFSQAHSELANVHVLNGDLDTAITCFKKAIELDPESVTSHYNLGKTLQTLGRTDEAVVFYERAIQLKPDLHEAYIDLASILLLQFSYNKIIDLLEAGSRYFPDSHELHFRLALAYQNQSNADAALEHYEKALDLDKGHVNAKTGAAAMLGMQGKYQAARKYLDEVIKLHPGNVTATTIFADFAAQYGETDRAIEMLTGQLDTGNYSDRMTSSLHFSIAKLYESRDKLDLAFRHYKSGNRLRHAKFDHAAHKHMFHDLEQAYSPRSLARLPRSGNQSTTPVFIVCMPRSGSSLVEQILSSHPDVFGAGELRNINYYVSRLSDRLNTRISYPRCLDKINETLLKELADIYLEDLLRISGGSHIVTDKMPINFIHLGFINLLFPKARIIHCTRDPIDTCLSCYFKNFSGEHPYAFDLSDLGKYYLIYKHLMEYWKKTLTLPMHEVKYEELVLNQERESRRLIEFCGLKWDDACLQFHTTDRTVSTASHDQVRRSLYTESIGRWRNYEKHLGPLLDSLGLEQ